MTKFYCKNINWDTTSDSPDDDVPQDLPSCVLVELDEPALAMNSDDPYLGVLEEKLADALSDQAGFCVNTFEWEIDKSEKRKRSKQRSKERKRSSAPVRWLANRFFLPFVTEEGQIGWRYDRGAGDRQTILEIYPEKRAVRAVFPGAHEDGSPMAWICTKAKDTPEAETTPAALLMYLREQMRGLQHQQGTSTLKTRSGWALGVIGDILRRQGA